MLALYRISHLTIVMVLLSFLLIVVPFANSLSFNLTTFDQNTGEITLDGSKGSGSTARGDGKASISADGRLFLTENTIYTTGRVTYNEALNLWNENNGTLADFTTHFSFIIDSQNATSYADGIAFFIASENFTLPFKQEGSGLGLVGSDHLPLPDSSAAPFVAVEFDTFNNIWDPVGDHAGINLNSVKSVKNIGWSSNIEAGVKSEAWISYNASTKNLSVVFTGHNVQDNSTFLQHLYHVVDLRESLPEWVSIGFVAACGALSEIHTILSWEFDSNMVPVNKLKTTTNTTTTTTMNTNTTSLSPLVPHTRNRNELGLIVGSCIGGFICLCVLLLGFVLWRRLKKQRANEAFMNQVLENDPTGPRKISYKQLAKATSNFSEQAKLGEGGFGQVYKGTIKGRNTSVEVAVKRVSKESKQGIKEYASEIRVITRLRHRNLVQLLGWCHEKEDLLLVYEYVPHGSLDSHLFSPAVSLLWPIRYKIAKGLASALLYLHEECDQYVIHRDIKSSNIMLDMNYGVKLGDFGLARLVDHGKGSKTTVLGGTRGYMDPESVITGKTTKQSDVYSFGIVALEIACGRRPLCPEAQTKNEVNLMEWVWELHENGNLLEAVDSKLGSEFNWKELECLLIVGLWCAQPEQKLRPSIRQASLVLNFEAPLPYLPVKTASSSISTPRTVEDGGFSGSNQISSSDDYTNSTFSGGPSLS